MKNIVICAAVIALLPNMANAASCSTCPIKFPDDASADEVTWIKSGNYYTTQAKFPTASSIYTGVCETSCYGTSESYSTAYTCGRGYATMNTSSGSSGYLTHITGYGYPETRAYNATGYFACVICPHGSYSAYYGQVNCTLCSGGYTTTGNGGYSCSYTCPGYNYTETWESPSWVSGKNSSVSNICVATKCKAGAYLNGTKCTACTAGTYNPNAGATSSSACIACPAATGIYTDAARTTLAVATSAAGTGSSSGCYLAPGTYYDNSGSFEITENCSY